MDWLIAILIFALALATLLRKYRPTKKEKITKKRGFLLIAFFIYWSLVAFSWLASILIVSISSFDMNRVLPPWWWLATFFVLLAINNFLRAIELICIIGIWKWKKWGLYGFLLLQLTGIILSIATHDYTLQAFIKDLALGLLYISILRPYRLLFN